MKKLFWNLVRVTLVMVLALMSLAGPATAYAAETGANVKELQGRLIELGYLGKGEDDGIFGPKTDYAVRWYQYDGGLDVDGIVGKKTARSLGLPYDEALYYEAYFKAKTGYVAVVSTKKCNFKTWQLVNNGYFDYWELIRDEDCCVGKDGKTPLGTYTISGKNDGFWKNNKFYAYFTGFSGDYGFHSVPISADGKVNNASLGHAQSAGCVRLKYETAEWLQDTLPEGTKVYIY